MVFRLPFALPLSSTSFSLLFCVCQTFENMFGGDKKKKKEIKRKEWNVSFFIIIIDVPFVIIII